MIFGAQLRHLQHRRLIREKIAAQRGFVKMLPFAVPLLAGDFIAGIDAALRTDAMAAFHRHHRKQDQQSTPSSASLMVQASPASPPPTTITLFLVAAITYLPSFFRFSSMNFMMMVQVADSKS